MSPICERALLFGRVPGFAHKSNIEKKMSVGFWWNDAENVIPNYRVR